MNALLVAVMFGAGVGGWAYVQLSRRAGLGNQKQAFLGGGAAGFMAFVFLFTLLKYVFQLS
jgi:hypothetical protein